MIHGRSAFAARLGPALLWGAAWGLWEATAGHAVHLLRVPGLAGAVMIPAAAAILSRVFAATGRLDAVFLTGCVAASLKFLDLAVPGRDLLAVLNPARFILLEALAAAGIFAALEAARRLREKRNAAPAKDRL